MIIQCARCKKRYTLDPNRITKDRIKLTCPSCKGVIVVVKPRPETESPASPAPPVREPSERSQAVPAAGGGQTASPTEPPRPPHTAPAAENPPPKGKPAPRPAAAASPLAAGAGKIKGMGLRTRLLIQVLVPLTLAIAFGGIYSLHQMDKVGEIMTTSTKRSLSRIAEEMVEQVSLGVAEQVRLYIEARPEMTYEEIFDTPEFRELGLQPVGQTGYTSVYERTPDGRFIMRTHADPSLVDVDITKVRKTKLKESRYDTWWNIFVGPTEEEETKAGYYDWLDPDGVVRKKFMVVSRVKGTPLLVAATTYVDEFLLPVAKMTDSITRLSVVTRNTLAVTIVITLAVVVALVTLYARRIINTIVGLARVADDISLGNLDAAVEVKATDELGLLADSITRMQDSMRTAIKRLRRRRRAAV